MEGLGRQKPKPKLKPKEFGDYTEAERMKLTDSIREKLNTDKPFTEEEHAFFEAQRMYWSEGDQPRRH